MDGYFKPICRKLAVVTLAMACVFLVAWIRSGVVQDSVAVVVADELSYHLISANQHLTVISVRTNYSDRLRTFRYWSDPLQPKADPLQPNAPFIVHYGSISFTQLGPAPFRSYEASLESVVGTGPNAKKTYAYFYPFSLPHWSIVVPLTLLSTYLLLSSARLKKIKPIESATKTEPRPCENSFAAGGAK